MTKLRSLFANVFKNRFSKKQQTKPDEQVEEQPNEPAIGDKNTDVVAAPNPAELTTQCGEGIASDMPEVEPNDEEEVRNQLTTDCQFGADSVEQTHSQEDQSVDRNQDELAKEVEQHSNTSVFELPQDISKDGELEEDKMNSDDGQ